MTFLVILFVGSTVWRETLEGADFGEIEKKTSLANNLWQLHDKSLLSIHKTNSSIQQSSVFIICVCSHAGRYK